MSFSKSPKSQRLCFCCIQRIFASQPSLVNRFWRTKSVEWHGEQFANISRRFVSTTKPVCASSAKLSVENASAVSDLASEGGVVAFGSGRIKKTVSATTIARHAATVKPTLCFFIGSRFYSYCDSMAFVVDVATWVPLWHHHGLRYSLTITCPYPYFIIAVLREVDFQSPMLPRQPVAGRLDGCTLPRGAVGDRYRPFLYPQVASPRMPPYR